MLKNYEDMRSSNKSILTEIMMSAQAEMHQRRQDWKTLFFSKYKKIYI